MLAVFGESFALWEGIGPTMGLGSLPLMESVADPSWGLGAPSGVMGGVSMELWGGWVAETGSFTQYPLAFLAWYWGVTLI